jgi:hypothetical protein
MANAADWLNAGRGPGPARPGGRAATQRSPLRHPPAEFGSTAPNRLGGDPARIVTLGKQSRFIE